MNALHATLPVVVLATLLASPQDTPQETPQETSQNRAAAAKAEGVDISFTAPEVHILGQPYEVEVTLRMPAVPTPVAPWLLQPSAFTVDGEPVHKRVEAEFLELPAGAELTLKFDLSPYVEATGDFELSYARGVFDDGPIQVAQYTPATAEDGSPLNFMELPAEQLAQYAAVLRTERGTMVAEFFPDIAPGHVRNFLDLCQDGFYRGTRFHRTMPGFMIQGGDPFTKHESQRERWGQGSGPRMLEAEFNSRPHVRGVLSMARGPSPDSASSQFFVVHGDANFLDNQYTAFGRLIAGEATLDRIATAPTQPPARQGAERSAPVDPVQILSTTVVQKP